MLTLMTELLYFRYQIKNKLIKSDNGLFEDTGITQPRKCIVHSKLIYVALFTEICLSNEVSIMKYLYNTSTQQLLV